MSILNSGDGILRDVKLNKDGSRYSLCLTYETTDKYGNIHEQVLDGVPLPIYMNPRCISSDITLFCDRACPERMIDVGYGMVNIPDEKFKVVDEIVEYATKEMSIDEIEFALGYKVKIVNKGKNEKFKEEKDE